MVLRRGKEDSDYTVTEVHVSPLSSEAHVNSEFRSPINSPNSTAAGAGLFLPAPLDNLFSLGQKLEKCIISLEFLCAFLRLSERISPWLLVDLCLLPPPPCSLDSPPPLPQDPKVYHFPCSPVQALKWGSGNKDGSERFLLVLFNICQFCAL